MCVHDCVFLPSHFANQIVCIQCMYYLYYPFPNETCVLPYVGNKLRPVRFMWSDNTNRVRSTNSFYIISNVILLIVDQCTGDNSYFVLDIQHHKRSLGCVMNYLVFVVIALDHDVQVLFKAVRAPLAQRPQCWNIKNGDIPAPMCESRDRDNLYADPVLMDRKIIPAFILSHRFWWMIGETSPPDYM